MKPLSKSAGSLVIVCDKALYKGLVAMMEGPSTSVALFLKAREKEEELKSFLSQKYKVTRGDAGAIFDRSFDIALVDPPSLEEHAESFRAAKRISRPVFLPILFVTKRERIKDVESSLLSVVDDFIILPVEELELMTRVEAYLKARFLSRDLERKVYALAERSPISIIIAEEGKIAYANPAFAWKLGESPSDLYGKSLIDIIHPEDREAFFRYLVESTIRGGLESPPGEARLMTPRGNVWMELFCSDIYMGERKYRVIFGVDVTRQRREKEERERTTEQLIKEAKMESISRLAGNMAHHFNNLLTTMKTYAELMLLSTTSAKEAEKYASKIAEAVDRAAELSKKLSLLAEGWCGESVPVSLNSTVSDVTEELKGSIPKDVRLVVEVDENLRRIDGDPESIKIALTNLVENSIEAMPEGGTLRISTRTTRLENSSTGGNPEDSDYSSVTVSDTGIGIPENIKDKVFEPFFTTKSSGNFPGLGLPITYRIVKKHGGFMEFASEYGRGTIVTLHFPTGDGESGKDLKSEKKTFQNDASRKTTILLVEDDQEVRESTAKLLDHSGFNVIKAGSTEDAKSKFEENSNEISLVLSDVMLPDGKGTELIRYLRTKNPELKALLVSGFVQEKEIASAIQEMNVPLLTKPYTFRKLLDAIKTALSKGG